MSNKYVLVLLAAVLYGLGGALIRPVTGSPGAVGEVSSFALGASRSLIALLLTLLVLRPLDCLLRKEAVTLPAFAWKSPWVWTSAVCRAVNTLSFATAIVFCSISTGYLLCNLTIVGMLTWQWLVDRKSPCAWQVATAAVVVASCVAYFAVDQHHASFVGVLAGIIGLFSFSGFFFFNGKIAQEEGPQFILGAVMLSHMLAPIFAVLAIFVCLGIDAQAGSSLSWARLWQPLHWPSTFALGLVLLLGVFQGGLADWFIAKGQAKKPNMMFMAFVPTLIMLWAPFLGWKTLGEQMFSPMTAIPFVVAHAAILYGSIRGARESQLRLVVVRD